MKNLANFLKRKGFSIVFFSFFLCLFFGFLIFNGVELLEKEENVAFSKIRLNGAVLSIETVFGEEEITRGLGGRNALLPDSGMFFILSQKTEAGFWMKDMKFPIDIIWFDEDFKVSGIKENADPKSYPEIFYPESESLYVLETEHGFSEKYKIKIGDQAEVF